MTHANNCYEAFLQGLPTIVAVLTFWLGVGIAELIMRLKK